MLSRIYLILALTHLFAQFKWSSSRFKKADSGENKEELQSKSKHLDFTKGKYPKANAFYLWLTN